MAQDIDELKRRIARLQTELRESDPAKKLNAADRRFGRVIGVIKALGWAVCAVFAYLTGAMVLTISDGWLAFAATMATASLILYAVWRAYRSLFYAQRLSEFFVDELVDRVRPVETALRTADNMRQRFGDRSWR